ncbi:hypothetical protein Rhe02_69530 [Rhizocola hellebori]|uniref:HTH araC/xylS-type domain-containing protein n=2 Tax=Rhizocola hellebori TaxID=1392758 RepID=A0A8J3QGH8_9ACTN|nr:hypothetical protein Rhe02_69530 [Rhizocola hellebori]
MILDRWVCQHERHLFDGPGFVWGEFRCPPADGLWRTDNRIREHAVVAFAGSAVRITAGRFDTVATNESVWYSPGVRYRRTMVATRGDHCTFVALSPELAARLRIRPGVQARVCTDRAVMAAYRIRREIACGHPDELALEELALTTLAELSGADEALSGTSKEVEKIKEAIAADPGRQWSLAELAAIAHYSPWFLSRMFPRVTGMSLWAYRRQQRLRASLQEALRPEANLAAVAQRYGFSSHSHYSRVFREAFGCTPSAARDGSARAL